jgi:hypothetical protein
MNAYILQVLTPWAHKIYASDSINALSVIASVSWEYI